MSQVLRHKLSVAISSEYDSIQGIEARERSTTIALPATFSLTDVHRLQKDLETIARIVKQYPEEILEIQNQILDHDYSGARSLAHAIGLTEASLAANHAGRWGVVTVIAIAAVLLERD